MADPPNKLNVPVNNDYALSVEKSLELPTVMDEGVFRSYLNNSNIVRPSRAARTTHQVPQLIRPNADSNAFMQMARAAGSNAGSGAGSFLREVAKQSGLIGSLAAKAHRVLPDPNPVGQESAVDEATYEATEMALNAAYNTVVKSFEAEFHRLGFESLIPMAMPLHQKRQLFQWSRDESKSTKPPCPAFLSKSRPATSGAEPSRHLAEARGRHLLRPGLHQHLFAASPRQYGFAH
jgi:hypothetical protein